MGIVTHDLPRTAVEWLRQNGGLPFTTLVDHRDRMANRYGIRAFPQLYVIAADGRVAYHGRGTTTMEALAAVLASLTDPEP
jgi:peroxiredoxin